LAIANIASYNASKGAIDQLTRAMALALVDHGIRVNAVGTMNHRYRLGTNCSSRQRAGSAQNPEPNVSEAPRWTRRDCRFGRVLIEFGVE
jgi:NAD(P)-dependent dehydrogenase (short-subunit alcohol dehydrogenase family)